MPESTDAKKVYTWLRKADLKTQLESLLWASQEQALPTKKQTRKSRQMT